ncbi:hypothetical protein [Novosphingobium kaempferiae]|uniref:hypothetical protein n=1 Tax=Novosphingobium kaempferiae TaxID=2896849 RepID=UPI001E31830C|nr:hypothetical protein [Novosphingobium kaempferiae]
MQDWRTQSDGTHLSVEEVRRHARFAEAKAVLIDGLAGLYAADHRLRPLVEYERGVTFMLVVSLDALREPNDPAGGVAMQVLNEVLPNMSITPGRRLTDIVGNLRRDGLLEAVPSPLDARARLLRATPRGIAADSEWLAAFHAPLAILRPEVDYRAAAEHDPAFQRAFRLAGLRTLDIANQIMSANPPMDYFVKETVGFRVQMLLMQAIRDDPENRTPAGFYSDAARKGGVSRTHVRNVLKGAAERGFVTLPEPPDTRVQVPDVMIEAFDRWVAESLSSIDRVRAMSGFG